MDEQTRARMEAALQLIKAHDYAGAYRLLDGIDHPTAAKWRAQLQERITVPDTAPANTRRNSVLVNAVILLLVGLAMVAGAWLLTRDGYAMNRAEIVLHGQCSSNGYDFDVCAERAEATVRIYYDEVRHCTHSIGTDRRAAWLNCLADEGVSLVFYR